MKTIPTEYRPCTCKTPGYCSRHKMHKSKELLTLCRTRADYRELWDRQAEETSPPSKANRVLRYSTAVSRWIKAGRPVRSDEEVARIHAECCVPCKHYNHKKKCCGVCGCNVRADGENLLSKITGALFGRVSQALFNKIKMATEHCPKGKW